MLKTKYREYIAIAILLVLSAIPRFMHLGVSSYYGDETKVLFYKKVIPAKTFILEQRRGPVQYLVAWGAEKLSGGFEEENIRLPFAIAGLLAVVVFYLVAKNIVGVFPAFLATILFSFNGFFIAFSRTVQYQSFLLLFGLSSILFAQLFIKYHKSYFLLVSAVFTVLGVVTHPDIIFYLLISTYYVYSEIRQGNLKWQVAALWFFAPIALCSVVYYSTFYILLKDNSEYSRYLEKRLTGEGLRNSNSLLTYFIYNPVVICGVYILFAFLSKAPRVLIWWFCIPFLAFQVLFSNPGTHILNYIIPLFMLSTLGWLEVYQKSIKHRLKKMFLVVSCMALVIYVLSPFYFFNPMLNKGYPWVDTKFLGINISKIDQINYQLFVYGFPYRTQWKQVRSYFDQNLNEQVSSYESNDNMVVSAFYLYPKLLPAPGGNFKYYIYVKDSQTARMPAYDLLDKTLFQHQAELDNGNIQIYKIVKKPK